jgi:hypothetical protein
MPNITIQINTPTLVAGSHFKVRYRMLPAGMWSSYATQTNAAFVLTGLSAGNYELEVILVRDGVECPAIIKPFTVTAPFTCLIFATAIVQAGSQHNLEIDYTLPGGYVQPPCGWQVQVIGNTTNKTINYTTLPASPIKIPVANEGLLVRVIANLCDGKTQVCYEGDVLSIPEPCVPITVSSVTVSFVAVQPNGTNRFKLTFNFTQSMPPTQWFAINIFQENPGLSPKPQTIYTLSAPFGPVSPTATSFNVYIDANPNVFQSNYYFSWHIIDYCGHHFFNPVGEYLHIQL